MSAANGERYYYQDDDDFKKLAGSLRDKYDIHSWFDLYYDPRVTKEEHWAMLLRHIMHLYEAITCRTTCGKNCHRTLNLRQLLNIDNKLGIVS